MNAKKIMGAVLVALLAAALFVGAGAAADKTDMGVVFINQKLTSTDFPVGTWTSGANTISVVSAGSNTYFDGGANFVEGVYENATAKVTVKYPTATLTGVASVLPATTPATQYMVVGGTLYQGDSVTLSATSAATAAQNTDIAGLRITYPDGSVITTNTNSWTPGTTPTTLPATGEYIIQPVFITGIFVDGTPANLLYSKATYTLTVAEADDVKLSAATESVLESTVTEITVTAKPGSTVKLTAEKFTIISVNGNTDGMNGVTISGVNAEFTMPNTGKATVYVMAGSETGAGKIKVTDKDASVSLTVTAGAISAATEKDSYYIGDEIKITGTSTAGKTLYVYLEGTNVKLAQITGKSISVKTDGTWEVKLKYSDLTTAAGKAKLDAGTYTIYISNKNAAEPGFPTNWKASDLKAYTTVSVALKQPFISVTDAPSVAVKGSEYVVKGTAEATDYIYAYVFGTNFFAAKTNKVLDDATAKKFYSSSLSAIGDKDFSLSLEKNEFTVELDIPETGMAAGQYFMVIQHPMYDEKFNIWANETKITTAATVNGALSLANKTVLFDVKDRQSANAAQALCDALETQNIDDMYVKLSFVVANIESTINPIPAEITKGSKLTVSGQTNMGEGKIVTVEMMSTAFAAVPKETVGSASFIALTTKTNEDGTWEVTFDTTGLNVDEYTVSVAVESVNTGSPVKINVIEGAPTEQPTEPQPTQTTTPTQPTETPVQTPGFGALAALAGLGAVAVLLLRRE